MKNSLIILSALALTSVFGQAQDETVTLEDDKSRGSYAVGYNMGMSIVNQGADDFVTEEILVKGLLDALQSNDPLLTDDEIRTAFETLRQNLDAAMTKKREEDSAANLAAAKIFFEENAAKDGVVTLRSGLQYRIIEEGEGESPAINDTVEANYAGRLLDGTEFDAGNAKFPVAGVIKGWTEALQLMKPGAKWELYIPSNLAYGPQGRQPKIGPDAPLIFDVELVSIEKARPAANTRAVTSDIIKVPSKEEMEKGAEIEVIKKEDVEAEIERQRQAQ